MADLMVELYAWGSPYGWIDTVNGEMRYRDWLNAERDRMLTASGRKIQMRGREREDGSNQVSLWVWPYCSVKGCHRLAVKFINKKEGKGSVICKKCKVAGRY